MPELITERLRLRRWRAEDVEAMTAINSDPEVMRWISDGSLSDRDRTAASIARYERSWDQNGFGLFAVELRASGELAFHVLEVMEAFQTSSDSGKAVAISTRPERPASLPPSLRVGELD